MPGEAPRAAIGILLIGAGTWLLLLLSSSSQQPHEGGACSSATPTLAELFEQRMKHDRRRIHREVAAECACDGCDWRELPLSRGRPSLHVIQMTLCV